jgi:hypothetical protein
VLALPPVRSRAIGAAPRIGFCRTPIWNEAEADTQALLEKTASTLGAKEVAFAPQFKDILDDHGAITGWESLRNYADERLRNPDKVSAELMAILKKSDGITLDRYVAAQRKTVAFKAFIDSLFDDFDVLLCPSAPGEAPKGQEFTGNPRFNSIWTLAGTPCVTLPAGTGADWPAARHPARRPAPRRRQAALHRRLGGGAPVGGRVTCPRSTANDSWPTCGASPISAATRPACIARISRRRTSRAATGWPIA